MSVKNRDLYRQHNGRDHLYVVTNEPQQDGKRMVVSVDMGKDAAVIDKHRADYPHQPYSVGDIRGGKDGLWLLSGGTLITNHQGQIAIGLRDGNAADPFTFTNIGAGRCDRKLQDHCMEEFHSEFILCVKDPSGNWVQMKFDESAPDLSEIRAKSPAIAKWEVHIGQPRDLARPQPALKSGLPGMTTLAVEWKEGSQIQDREVLEGYTFLDQQNHTLEFRLPIELDLSTHGDVATFYAEGTGYAVWKTPRQIRDLARLQQTFGTILVTPLLAGIVANWE